ncbi:Z-ring-associated protein ZapA [hydrothermal vent metagenome]|uniref:Cell division protein ZapA n=1 Tax=hydrothermal vent metagenome TaxID=652676 RepID=A0A3B0Y065_9ZZZZ
MSKASPMRIHILDKEYLVACPDDEREALFASAEFLTDKMKEIRDTGKIVGADRIAVMAALNMAHELLENRGTKQDYQFDVSKRIRALQDKIDVALNQGNQLEF